jgi:hypothetical protein
LSAVVSHCLLGQSLLACLVLLGWLLAVHSWVLPLFGNTVQNHRTTVKAAHHSSQLKSAISANKEPAVHRELSSQFPLHNRPPKKRSRSLLAPLARKKVAANLKPPSLPTCI